MSAEEAGKWHCGTERKSELLDFLLLLSRLLTITNPPPSFPSSIPSDEPKEKHSKCKHS